MLIDARLPAQSQLTAREQPAVSEFPDKVLLLQSSTSMCGAHADNSKARDSSQVMLMLCTQ